MMVTMMVTMMTMMMMMVKIKIPKGCAVSSDDGDNGDDDDDDDDNLKNKLIDQYEHVKKRELVLNYQSCVFFSSSTWILKQRVAV